jgi:flavorubredoxin
MQENRGVWQLRLEWRGGKIFIGRFSDAGFEVVVEGMWVFWVPEEEGAQSCREYGKKVVASV